MIKPPALRRGDAVSLVAPAGALSPEALETAMERIRELGLEPRPCSRVLARRDYLAGADEVRLEDLRSALADPGTRAVFALRGGYGTARLLPFLDLSFLRSRPKAVIGFSDLTALHLALDRLGIVSFHGPMPGVGEWSDYERAGLWRALGGGLPGEIPLPQGEALPAGEARGPLVGGNLSVLAASLGTPWEVRTAGRILLLEEVGEAPYRIDRLLNQLRQAGKLSRVRGILLGEVAGVPPTDALRVEEVFREYLDGLGVPVLRGLPFGHGSRRGTLPLGVLARIRNGRLFIEEAATA